MDPTRAKALEMAIIFSSTHQLENGQQLIDLAEIFRTYIEPPEPTPAPDADYPRIQVP